MADPDSLEYYPLPEGYGADPTARVAIRPGMGDLAATDTYSPDDFEAAAGRVQRRYPSAPKVILPERAGDGVMGSLADLGQGLAAVPGNVGRGAETAFNFLSNPASYATSQPPPSDAIQPPPYVAPGQGSRAAQIGGAAIGVPIKRAATLLSVPHDVATGEFDPMLNSTEAADLAAEAATSLVGQGMRFARPGGFGVAGGRMVQPTMDVPMRPGSGGMSDIAAPPRARTLFNYSRINEVPDVPQIDLPRYAPPRGTSPRVQDLITNPAVAQQMLNKIEEGRNINAQTFYYNEPLRQAFISELGKRKGDPAFARYMDYVAASSPRSDVEANARNASYYYMLQQQGLPVPPKGGVNPQPYGHMAQNLHRLNAERIRSGDYFDAIKNPKPLSFSANLQGNFAPVTVDAHAFKLPGMLARDPRFLATSVALDKGSTVYPQRMFNSGEINMEDALARPVYWASKPNANEYGAMEQYYKQLAQRAGMAPAQAQAAAWAGGGPMTGLASVAGDPFMRSVENRANLTAARRGISPQEALSRMIRGREPLLALPFIPAAGAAMGGLAQQDNYQ